MKLVNQLKSNVQKLSNIISKDGGTNSVHMLVIIPLISSLCNKGIIEITTLVKYTIENFISLFKLLFNFIVLKFYKRLIVNKVNKVYVKIYEKPDSGYSSRNKPMYDDNGKCLIWYLNTCGALNKYSIIKTIDTDLNEPSYGSPSVDGNSELSGLSLPYFDINISSRVLQIESPESKSMDKGKNNSPMYDETYNSNDPVHLENGIYMDIHSNNINQYLYIILFSATRTTDEIAQFLSDVRKKYKKHLEKSKNIPKIMIYKYTEDDKPVFASYNLDRTQTLDNIFHDSSEKISHDVKLLEDKSFYKKYGLKRKLGYLFYGPPGSGKTCMVTALANQLGRSIVYIPISHIQNSNELMDIIYGGKYNGVEYALDEIVFCFDEIDSCKELIKDNNKSKSNNGANMNMMDKKLIDTVMKLDKKIEKLMDSDVSPKNGAHNENNCEYSKNNKDKADDVKGIDIGMMLSLFDGNTDQNGAIITGTANSINNIDPALYRDGRLKLVECSYMSRKNIVDMLKFYGFDMNHVSDEILDTIPNTQNVQSLTIKMAVIDCIKEKKSLDDTLGCIVSLFS